MLHATTATDPPTRAAAAQATPTDADGICRGEHESAPRARDISGTWPMTSVPESGAGSSEEATEVTGMLVPGRGRGPPTDPGMTGGSFWGSIGTWRGIDGWAVSARCAATSAAGS
eukprot:CAMPEP_0181243348 /NCGR_PEP_ID=MMETSP1096-20121128/42218_1 /TAXON_ID=156174 ORGANISM="Chrysochromulina ericina, Strain CCMP281" /NCGR_SAMPLE_ID=MMETSP1096 /ASSEMBLY_ACC=CAM_ASM_000453 /LENGTH=114 /DNA_ID=CAMNT_0023339703 /DNA_START=119 /DNA_END=464 /DNA_ORIENTATION=+